MNDLDLFLRTALESFDFDQTALSEILRSLCQDRHESPFYSELLESSAFNQLWQQQHKAKMEMQRRNEDYVEALGLKDRIRELKEKDDSLSKEIELRERGGGTQDR